MNKSMCDGCKYGEVVGKPTVIENKHHTIWMDGNQVICHFKGAMCMSMDASGKMVCSSYEVEE